MSNEQPVVMVLSAGEFARRALSEVIGYSGCRVVWIESDEEWPEEANRLKPDVIFADEDALHLRTIMNRAPKVPLVLAVQASGGVSPVIHNVFRAVGKPVSPAQAVLGIARALVFRRVAIDCWTQTREDVSTLLGRSASMQAVYGRMSEIAVADGHVLLGGERGSGLAAIARAIHDGSRRVREPIEFVNCRDVHKVSFDKLLFGHLRQCSHEAGSRTLHGTLFLGEVGKLSLPLQRKLLTALQERRASVEGSAAEEIDLNLRVIAATSDRLEKLVEEGRFSPELLALLSTHRLEVPPLRERKDDVSFLARALIGEIGIEPVLVGPELPATTEALMLVYQWPGNVEELRWVLGRAAARTEGPISTKDVGLPRAHDEADYEDTLATLAARAQEQLASEEFASPQEERESDDGADTLPC